MTLRTLMGCACLLLPLWTGGCDSRGNRFEAKLDLLGPPVALDRQLVFVDRGLHRALMLDVSGEHPGRKHSSVSLPYGPTAAERRSGDADEVLVLSSGRAETTKKDAINAALTRLSSGGKTTEYDLTKNPFDRMEQSDDGRHVLLRRETQGDHLLESVNVVALIDMEADVPDAVHFHTLDFRPTGVVYSPPMEIGGETRSLAVALSDSAVAIIDLGHPTRRVTTVSLSIDAGRLVQPEQLLFDPQRARIYIRPGATTDVFALRLTPRDVSADRNDFATAIDILGTEGYPSDMALYGEGDDQRLLVLSNSSGRGLASIVDPSTSRTTQVALDRTANQVDLFTTGPDDAKVEHALLWNIEDTVAMVLDLDKVEELRDRNLELLPPLPAPVARAIALPGDSRMLLVHTTPGLSLLDLDTRSVSPFAASSSFSDAIFDIDRGRIWVAPPGQDRVGFVQVDGGATDEVLLDANIQSVVPVLSQDRLAVVHGGEAGYLTLVDVTDPRRSALHVLEGFLLHGLLD